MNNHIEVFSTCPSSLGIEVGAYLQRVIDVARWSEHCGCKGILVYSDNSLVDPWLVAQIIIQNTESLCPLVAVQPVYMHPYWVAKIVTTLGYFHGRRVYLNMIAGGFTNDLVALNDGTPHDKRYARLVEYTTIIKELLLGQGPVSYLGEFYKVDRLKLTPPLPPELFPGVFMSGSSEAGLASAKAVGGTAVKYPKPPGEEDVAAADDGTPYGVRVGIISREDDATAWEVAHARFPDDRKGQLTHQLAMKTSDSLWHKQLSRLGEAEDSPYWLGPFQNYRTFCPYLVGSYDRVGRELAKYIAIGYKTFILDIPANEEELSHTQVAFQRSVSQVA